MSPLPFIGVLTDKPDEIRCRKLIGGGNAVQVKGLIDLAV